MFCLLDIFGHLRLHVFRCSSSPWLNSKTWDRDTKGRNLWKKWCLLQANNLMCFYVKILSLHCIVWVNFGFLDVEIINVSIFKNSRGPMATRDLVVCVSLRVFLTEYILALPTLAHFYTFTNEWHFFIFFNISYFCICTILLTAILP